MEMHFSGCRVHSPEIEFSPNPFRSTSFKDDLGKKILGASICQIVNRAIRLGEDIHLFFLHIKITICFDISMQANFKALILSEEERIYHIIHLCRQHDLNLQ